MAEKQEEERRHWLVSGAVQGVGFRFWLQERAQATGVRGWVRNLADGRVEAVGAAPGAVLDRLEAELRRGPPGARVAAVAGRRWSDAVEGEGFERRPDAAGDPEA